jgi:hypothetical protein
VHAVTVGLVSEHLRTIDKHELVTALGAQMA